MPKRRKLTLLKKDLIEVVEREVAALVESVALLVRHGTAHEIIDRLNATDPARTRPKRILPCIAPGCRNMSKGPRFHYLCEDHRNAPKRDWTAWQKAQKPRKAQAPSESAERD